MKMIGVIGMCIFMLLLVSCESSYTDCKSDCQKYMRNCSIEGSFCIPSPCNTNHICNSDDLIYCINECKGGFNFE